MKQLRFSTTKPMAMLGIGNPPEDHMPLVTPKNVGEIIMTKTRSTTAYIHGDAEELAGYDVPTFFDGDIGQLDLPVEEQNILMLLPSGEYKCKSEFTGSQGYLITLT